MAVTGRPFPGLLGLLGLLGLVVAMLVVAGGSPADAQGQRGAVTGSLTASCVYNGRTLASITAPAQQVSMDKALARRGLPGQYVAIQVSLQGKATSGWRRVASHPASKRAPTVSVLTHAHRWTAIPPKRRQRSMLSFSGAQLASAYTAFRVQLRLQWYAPDGRTVRGSAIRTTSTCARTLPPPPPLVTRIVAGSGYACALMSDTSMRCWGYNGSGRDGDGSTTSQLHPVTPRGMTSGVNSIAIATGTTCAVKSYAAYCWGRGEVGQIGNGATAASQLTPTPVKGLSTVYKVYGGGSLTLCASSGNQPLKCWGGNSSGQIGNLSTTNSATPVAVTSMGNNYATDASTGGTSSCATNGTSLYCWGANNYQQLGSAANSSIHGMSAVPGMSSVSQVRVGGAHACAISVGAVSCWGLDTSGQLGNGAHTGTSGPVAIKSLASGVTSVEAVGSSSCAVRSGQVYCWGANANGQVIPGQTTNADVPTLVAGPTNVVGVALGSTDAYAWDAAGDVWSWGDNAYGQLGTGDALARTTVVKVSIH